MKRDDSVYLRHILDAISRIEEYLQDVDEAAFHQRYLVQDGVLTQPDPTAPDWPVAGR